MEPRLCIASLCLNLVLLALAPGWSYAQTTDNEDLQRTLVKRMDTIQDQLLKATDYLNDLNTDLERALDECLGIHSELCEAIEIESRMKDRRELGSFWSPGKRSQDPKLDRNLAVLKELRRKRAVLGRVMNAFKSADNVMTSERKRSCQVNLGFHCDTEHIADWADMYDYLSTSLSPGKKRSVSNTLGRRRRSIYA